MINVRLVQNSPIKATLRPEKGIRVDDHTTYLYDPTLIDAAVAEAKDWAIKQTGKVEEDGEQVDYSSKAWAIGGSGTETNNAKYYAEQASDSATSAASSASDALGSATAAATSEGIATNKASQAAQSASDALSYSQSAASSANDASHSAGEASASEINAASSASTASTQAGIATSKATEAAGSASSASTSATNAQTWAEGSDAQVSLIGGEHSSKGWAKVAQDFVESIGAVLRYKGSVETRDDLPTSGQEIGDMYNILSDGANCVWDGSDWDEISGIVDLSEYRKAADQDTIDAGKVPTSRTINNKSLTEDITLTPADVGAQPAGNYVTTDTTQTISAAKTFTKAVHFTGTGDTNAVFLTENTRIDVEGKTRTILGMGNGQFYINHSAYDLLLRGRQTRPKYNGSDLALKSDIPTTYIHEQGVSSAVWTVQHNLNKYPSVTVVDSSGNELITEIEYVDTNTVQITMNGASKGRAYLN